MPWALPAQVEKLPIGSIHILVKYGSCGSVPLDFATPARRRVRN
jgi:hypothetical protein